VAHAYAIGHKKIDIFDPVTADSVRLKVLETSGQAGIREFGVFNGTAVH
jgi:alpha-L-fucosidase